MAQTIVTKLHIISRCGANGRPTSGDVTFSDGKTYGWIDHPGQGGICFFNDRKRDGAWERYSFRSTTRAAALHAKIY